MDLESRLYGLAQEAERIKTHVEFCESGTRLRREITMSHVYLESAKNAARRALEAIERVCADAGAIREAAE